ncbi:MAG: hypothetical protein CMN30_22570 [Sandaracinus sp.]|nr:hypothetical protein [Sandaracinus sp.]
MLPSLPATIRRALRLCCALAALLTASACSNSASPTLPIPPPSALSSAPDDEGMVTIEGRNAVEGAMVSAFNERLEVGTIGVADDLGEFTLRLPAESGDSLSVWQSVGVQRGEILTIRVPDP